MPELPEVETVVRGLINSDIVGCEISTVELFRSSLRYQFPDNFRKNLLDKKVVNIRRRAKYILLDLSDNITLVIHLGMSGRLLLDPVDSSKHDHVKILLHKRDSKKDNCITKTLRVVYRDPRRFGYMDIVGTGLLESSRYFSHLGIEPLSDKLSVELFYGLLQHKKRNSIIKQALLDQKLIVGLGNIYVCEALFKAKINPDRKCSDINMTEAKALLLALKEVLLSAIDSGGTTLKDYRTLKGDLGYFQQRLLVYGRAGENCTDCGVLSTVSRKIHGGRSTFYCKMCQR